MKNIFPTLALAAVLAACGKTNAPKAVYEEGTPQRGLQEKLFVTSATDFQNENQTAQVAEDLTKTLLESFPQQEQLIQAAETQNLDLTQAFVASQSTPEAKKHFFVENARNIATVVYKLYLSTADEQFRGIVDEKLAKLRVALPNQDIDQLMTVLPEHVKSSPILQTVVGMVQQTNELSPAGELQLNKDIYQNIKSSLDQKSIAGFQTSQNLLDIAVFGIATIANKPQLADTVKKVGSALIKAGQSLVLYNTKKIVGKALTGDLISVGLSLIGAFMGSKDPAQLQQEQIQTALAEINQQLEMIRKDLQVTNAKLDAVMKTLSEGFANMERWSKAHTVQLNNLARQFDQLQMEINQNFQDVFNHAINSNYERCLGANSLTFTTDVDAPREYVSGCLAEFFNQGTRLSKNNVFSGTDSVVFESLELKDALKTIRYRYALIAKLRGIPVTAIQQSHDDDATIANPMVWLHASERYMKMYRLHATSLDKKSREAAIYSLNQLYVTGAQLESFLKTFASTHSLESLTLGYANQLNRYARSDVPFEKDQQESFTLARALLEIAFDLNTNDQADRQPLLVAAFQSQDRLPDAAALIRARDNQTAQLQRAEWDGKIASLILQVRQEQAQGRTIPTEFWITNTMKKIRVTLDMLAAAK